MKALSFSPQIVNIQKAGADASFYEALGEPGLGIWGSSSIMPYANGEHRPTEGCERC
jgi:hypothetical protein